MNRSHYAYWLRSAAALAAGMALTAQAQATDASGATPYSLWAGFYAGTVYGAGLGLDRSSQTGSHSASGLGQTTGALLGYNFQAGRYIYGGEGDFSYHLLRPENSGAPGLSPIFDDTPQTVRLRARLGYDLGAFLPFVAGGVATARFYEAGTVTPLVQWGQTREVTGLTLGAGLEWRYDAPIIGPVVLRGEYILDAYPTTAFAVYPTQSPIRTQNIEQFFRVGLISYLDPTWRPPAATANRFDWSGSYGGVLGGGASAQPRTTLTGSPATTTSAAGPLAGIFTGRNFMLGSFVVGYEGVVEAADVTGSGAEPGIASVSYRNYFDTELRARAGYAFGRLLPYLTFGMDWGRSEETDPATGSYRGRVPNDGVEAGAGLEYGFDDHWSARIEYLYSTPASTQWTRLDDATLALYQNRQAETLRAGLAYYFH